MSDDAQWTQTEKVTRVYRIKDGRELSAQAEVTFERGEVFSIILDYGVGLKVKILGPRPIELLKKLFEHLDKEAEKGQKP